jgi:hypothetical protein
LDRSFEEKGCPRIAINECEEHFQSKLDTVTLRVDVGKTGKLKFLIDTGAEISIVKSNSMLPGINY